MRRWRPGAAVPPHGLPAGLRVTAGHLQTIREREGLPPLARAYPSQPGTEPVQRDGVEPGIEAGGKAEAVQGSEGPQEDLLDRVFGFLMAAQHAVGQGKEQGGVAFHQLCEGLGVPLQGFLHGQQIPGIAVG